MNRSTRLLRALLLGLLAAALLAPAAIADDAAAIKRIKSRLESPEVWDRISALRDLMRLSPGEKVARPLLESLMDDPHSDVRGEVVWGIFETMGAKGGDLLEKLYKDPDRRVRDSAIRAACRLWEAERTRDLCLVASEDPDFGARIEVINTLREKFPNETEAKKIFRKSLGDASEMVQRSAIFGVQAGRDGASVPALAKIARTSSDLAAVPAVDEALATIGTPEAVDVLVGLLPRPKPDPDSELPPRPSDLVRAAAARALARIKDPASIPELRKLIDDPSHPVRIGAMEALMQMKDKQSVKAISAQLKDETPRIRQFALRALRNIGDPSCQKEVRQVLRNDSDDIVRATAAITIADLLGEDAIGDLQALRADLSSSVRLEAAGALSGMGEAATDSLAVFLDDSSEAVQLMAVEGLGQIGDEKHVAAIAAIADNDKKSAAQLRMKVAEALGRIGSEKGLPALLKLSKDRAPAVRQFAATALGEVGGDKAKARLDEMTKQETVASVRDAARRAKENLR